MKWGYPRPSGTPTSMFSRLPGRWPAVRVDARNGLAERGSSRYRLDNDADTNTATANNRGLARVYSADVHGGCMVSSGPPGPSGTIRGELLSAIQQVSGSSPFSRRNIEDQALNGRSRSDRGCCPRA